MSTETINTVIWLIACAAAFWCGYERGWNAGLDYSIKKVSELTERMGSDDD